MPTFSPRPCPSCGTSSSSKLIQLDGASFADTNWTYSPQWRRLLGLTGMETFEVSRCSDCSFIYAPLLPSADFLKTLYEQVIESSKCVEGSEVASGYATRLRYIADLISLSKPGRALDFGSGAGVSLRILKACLVDAVGFDPSESRVKYSSESVVATTKERLLDEAPFSMVVADNVLEHLPDPQSDLRFIWHVTSPGAIVFVSVPSYEEQFIESQLAAQKAGRPLDMTLNPWEHLNYFSAATLEQMMNSCGFLRLRACEIPGPPDIGLRAEPARWRRLKNGLASATRLLRYTRTGDGTPNVQRLFFRRTDILSSPVRTMPVA